MFAEWVIGTSLQSYIPKPNAKPKRKDVIRVEVTTDDESEADTLKITYPRLSNLENKSQDSIKKVRFEEKPKSALKQTKLGSDADTSASEATTGSEAATDSEAECEKSKAKKKKSKKKDESEPHPTCKCTKCVKGRQKQKQDKKAEEKKKKKQEESDAESSDASDKNESTKDKKQDKGGKKENKKEENADSSATEGEITEGEKTDDDNAGKKDNGKKESKKDEKKKKGGGDKATENKGGKEKATQQTQPSGPEQQKTYPEAYPFYHPRLPNLIGPIRAQVVQTEPVVETSEDPPPNAFYDAEHNIMRVYHGPVYGNHFSRSLYPKRDQANRPLPVGMPHPAQNPYLFGFKNLPGPSGQENVPAWTHHGFPRGEHHPPPAPPEHHQHQHQHQHQQHRQPSNGNGSKGAFSRVAVGPNDDVAGKNNVTPAAAQVSKHHLEDTRLVLN